MISKELQRFFLWEYGKIAFSMGIALLIEFVPTRVNQFFEGDLTIAHKCGNTVR